MRAVFTQLYAQRVMFEGMILKANMVLPGLGCPIQESVKEVAAATVKCLLHVVPAAVPGVAFLSGGQSCELRFGAFECHECPVEFAGTVGFGVFLRARHPTAGFRDMEGRGG